MQGGRFLEVAEKLTFPKKIGNIDTLIFLDRYYFAPFFKHTRTCVKILAGHFSKLLCVHLTLPSVCVTFRKCEKNVRNLRKCESIVNRLLFYLRGSHIPPPQLWGLHAAAGCML